jgi:hypothetical protein
MANNIAFQPMGNTVAVFAATANTQGNVALITAVSPCNQYFVFNPDKNDPVFVAYGETDSVNGYHSYVDGRQCGSGGNSPIHGKDFHWPTSQCNKNCVCSYYLDA